MSSTSSDLYVEVLMDSLKWLGTIPVQILNYVVDLECAYGFVLFLLLHLPYLEHYHYSGCLCSLLSTWSRNTDDLIIVFEAGSRFVCFSNENFSTIFPFVYEIIIIVIIGLYVNVNFWLVCWWPP